VTRLVEPADLEEFRTAVTRRLGLQFADDKLDQLAGVLHRRLESTGCEHVATYLSRLGRKSTWTEEQRGLAQQLTVGETYFFRNASQFLAFAEVALPACMRARRGSRTLRILSAGCASGDEAYSLAAVVRDHEGLAGWDVDVVGVDVNPSALERAARARYSEWSLRETSAPQRERYFRADGREFVLDERIRSTVTFEERNLVDDDPAFWRPEAFDVVFCRNVIMYFAPEVARRVVARFARALAPGGFLFLGHAEVLRGISDEFHLRHTHETFYYQLSERTERRDGLRTADIVEASPVADADWMEAIERASERIASLVRDGDGGEAVASASGSNGGAAAAATVLDTAMELVRRERFQEALDFLRRHPSPSGADRDAQLLLACLLANAGALDAADAACRELLAADELNAGAHYLMALCREHAGDRLAAVAHDEIAIYLDPTFTMPHLHLGLLARRVGDVELARRELGQVLTLLPHEDPVRLLLFGGGFGRDGLGALCRSELAACVGGP
jgi:chemotaxis protein methyltransferase CheR